MACRDEDKSRTQEEFRDGTLRNHLSHIETHLYDVPRCGCGAEASLYWARSRPTFSDEGASFTKIVDRVFNSLDWLWREAWIPALLTRLFVGYFFLETGWGKIHNLDSFTMRFQQWGIPYPAFNAALSAYTEFIGGALTIAGLGTRTVSIAMIINMAVAVLSVKLKSVSSLNDFAELDEPLYALTYLWLFFSGPGWLSLDALVKRSLRSRSRN